MPGTLHSYIHLCKVRDKDLEFISLEVMMLRMERKEQIQEISQGKNLLDLVSAWIWRSTPKSQA